MTVSLGPHVLANPANLASLMAAAQPGVIKHVDPSDRVILAPLTVGRLHAISEQKDLTNPYALAAVHADAVSRRADVTGIRVWEGINELHQAWVDADLCARFQDYELERSRLLHARGLGAAVLCINTGWPRERSDHTIDWSGVDTLLTSMGPDDLLDIHEYWRPDGPRGSAYLSEAGRFLRCPYPNVRIFTSEMGIDFSGGQRDGFRAHGVSPAEYALQFLAYRTLAAQDRRWVGGTPFTFGHFPGGDWESFDWEPFWGWFVDVMRPVETPPGLAINDISASLLHGMTPYGKRALTQITKLVIHHTVTPVTTTPQTIAKYHVNSNGWPGIGYHFVIGATGTIYQTNALQTVSYHVGDDNGKAVGLALLGDFTNSVPPAAQLQAAADLIRHLRGVLGWSVPVVGHNDLMQTQCPGNQWPTYRATLFGLLGETIGGTAMKLSDYHRPSGRVGLHLPPSPYHATNDITWALDKMQAMKVQWATVMDDGGGSCLQANPAYAGQHIIAMLRMRGIEPVVRLYASPHARFDSRMKDTAIRLRTAGVRYLFYINEPEVGGTEWGTAMPKNWVEIVTRNCVDFAYQAMPLGIYPGFWATTTWQFPDADGQLVNPLLAYMTEKERDDIFRNGSGWWAIHPYAKNHPKDYPFDAVNVMGTPMSHAEYEAHLAEVDPVYRATQHLWVFDDYQVNEAHINLLRTPHPDASLADDVCFNMYRGFNEYILKPAGLLDYVPIIATEVGPCVGDRDDGRYAKVTPQEQCRMIEQELQVAEQTPNFFGLTFWLAGCSRLGVMTADSFEDQGWWTDRHNEPFNLQGEMPIVPYLIARGLPPPDEPPVEPPPDPPEPPEEEPPVTEPLPELSAADLADIAQFGLRVVRAEVTPGEMHWRIVRVHHLTPLENSGNHHLYMDVWDHGGLRVNGTKLNVSWPTGAASAVIDKPADEPGTNMPIWRGQVVSAAVDSALKSDRIEGWRIDHPDEPPAEPHGDKGNTDGHHSLLVVWQAWDAPVVVEPEPEPEPEPAEPPAEDERRNFGWKLLGIAWYPDAAFYKEAKRLGLYGPRSNEGREVRNGVTYAGQVYYGPQGDVVLECVDGDYGNIIATRLIEQ